ncbi:MAG: hypothetical protein IT286_04460, partial [Proteobacteria bacterium]|nr:hypothetical protein [Pseudomonadota bacterium]
LFQRILPAFKRKKILIITNRNDRYMLAALRSAKMKLQLVKDGSLVAQNKIIETSIKKNLEKFDHILVWTGHLRLGSSQFQKRMQRFEPVYVYLQSNGLSWKFPKASGWNQFQNSFVWMDSSPLISVDHYRSSEEQDFVMIRPEMLHSIFIQMMGVIAKNLKQPKYEKPKQILHVFDHDGLQKLNQIKNETLKNFLKDRVMNGESAVMPSEKMVLLSTLNSSHMAEEAAHYLRTANQDKNEFGPAMTLIEEALAFFASLLLFPNRRIPVQKKSKNVWDEVHAQGYSLGYKLWKLWMTSDSSRPMIQKLWRLHPQSEFEAQMMFQVLIDLK